MKDGLMDKVEGSLRVVHKEQDIHKEIKFKHKQSLCDLITKQDQLNKTLQAAIVESVDTQNEIKLNSDKLAVVTKKEKEELKKMFTVTDEMYNKIKAGRAYAENRIQEIQNR